MTNDTNDATAGAEVRLVPDGPIMLRGRLTLQLPDGTSVDKTSVALCRCGASENKPFCDGAHRAIGFEG